MKKYILILVSILSISACGGGGTSTGRDDSFLFATETTTFSGTQNLRLSSADTTTTRQENLVIIASNTTVTVQNPHFNVVIPLDANNMFSRTTETSEEVNMIFDNRSCIGLLAYSGAVSGNTISGSVSGYYDCFEIPRINVTGTFSTTQTG